MADQRLEYTIAAIDRSRQAIEAVEARFKSLEAQVKRSNESMERSSKQAASGLDSIGRAAQGIAGVITGVLSGIFGIIQRLAGAVVDLAGRIAGVLVDAFKTLATTAGIAAAAIGGALLTALVAMGRSGVDFNITLEGARVALTRITGSSEGAARLIGQLREEAKLSALTFKEMLPIAQSLAAVYGPQGIGRVIPTMRAFQDTATALKVSTGGLQNALLGFRQLIGREFASAEELNQVSENLPGLDVRGILRRNFGTADTELLKKAKVSGRQVGEAIVAGMEESFGGSQRSLGGTIPVLLSNFEDAWNDLTSAITARFTPVLTSALAKLLEMFQRLASNEKFIRALAVPFELLGKALEYVAGLLPQFAEWLAEIVSRENIIRVLSQVAGWVSAISKEIMRFLGIVTGGKTFTDIWMAFGEGARTAIDTAIRLWNAFAAGIKYFIDHRKEFADALRDIFAGALAVVDVLIGAVAELVDLFLNLKTGGLWDILSKFMGWKGGGGGQQPVIRNQMGSQFGYSRDQTGREVFVGRPPSVMENALDAVTKTVRGFPGGPVQFEGVPGNFQSRGRSVREGAFGAIERGAGAFTGRAQDFGAGLWEAIQRGYSRGLPELEAEAARAAARAKQALERALPSGGGGAGSGSNMPPRNILANQRGGGRAVAPGGISDEQFKELMERRSAYFEAIEAQAELGLEAHRGSGEEALARAARLIPILKQQMEAVILPKLRRTLQGSKEFYDAQSEYFQLHGQIQRLQLNADDEARENAQKRIETMKRRQEQASGLLEKLIGSLPERARGLASRRLMGPRLDQLMGAARSEQDPDKRMGLLSDSLDLSSRIEGAQPKDPFGGFFATPENRARGNIVQMILNINASTPEQLEKGILDVLAAKRRLMFGR
jgi:hypothetical protein